MQASDTDSIYVRFKELIDKVQPNNPVDFLNKVAEEKVAEERITVRVEDNSQPQKNRRRPLFISFMAGRIKATIATHRRRCSM